ncbi:filamentous hemagglutinin N-terminal domain-containing protein [Oscillatoriales cyanobacterium LEGE 11467]|uniref:Filamentous hemagglutinin N-terminal domain-containing protein n=1 Tax=Zarconia navalis LEGE 11467 TaxID=1828826 RepID=A0A928Z8K2_9CYAN|nr:S-layer family protein [Zarconia navalis]MBE9040644.1 filamentous hemagglutinin N-terminal domain-containing protein [Zarconia navalis LEGE 11467]
MRDDFFLIPFLLSGSLLPAPVMAQIVSDTTLPTDSIAIPEGRTFTIDGGTTAGGNLFHSFDRFDVPTGFEAFFNNAPTIENIFGRVTGDTISNIDGSIRTNGMANLFLLNPNGIIFGPNAQLNLGGSFFGSTAESVVFADGSTFSATSPGGETGGVPLLTISVPVGLQLGSSPGSIRVEGTGAIANSIDPNGGLTVPVAQTLALVGGDITFRGGIASVNSGRLEIGSAANGVVGLMAPFSPENPTPNWGFNYDSIDNFRDIQLLDGSLWQYSALFDNPGSGIGIRGGKIAIEGSQIAARTLGEATGGEISLAAADLEIGAEAIVLSQVVPGAGGRGSPIEIETDRLTVRDGGLIQSQSLGTGTGGSITAIARRTVQIAGIGTTEAQNPNDFNPNSRISTLVTSTGNGGTIDLSTRNLTLIGGGQIETVATPTAIGHSGNITAIADSLNAIGANPFNPFLPSGIASTSLGTAPGGHLDVSADTFNFTEGGAIQSFSQGAGLGGNITVRATESITAVGVNLSLPAISSGIFTQVLGTGDGGSLDVTAPRIHLAEGGKISSLVIVPPMNAFPGAGTGNAGDLRVRAETVEVLGATPLALGNPSAISSVTFGAGDAGDVALSTRTLVLGEGGVVSSAVLLSTSTLGEPVPGAGTGKGGNLGIVASESIEVRGVEPVVLAPSRVGTATSGFGDSGITTIETPQLRVLDGGEVNSSTFAVGNAGQTIVNAREQIVVGGRSRDGSPASISANASILNPSLREIFFLPDVPTGDTGELSLQTDRLVVFDGGEIGVGHQGTGNAGQLQLRAATVLLDGDSRIGATTVSGQGGNITLNVREDLQLRGGSQITAEALGNLGDGGNLSIDAETIALLENSAIVANATTGVGGNIEIVTRGLFESPGSQITASSQLGVDGTIEIRRPDVDPQTGLVQLPQDTTDPTDRISKGCSVDRDDRFVILGREGLPEDPTTILRETSTWSDTRNWRDLSQTEETIAIPNVDRVSLVEATGWVRRVDGTLELVARSSGSPWHRDPDCRAGRSEFIPYSVFPSNQL